MWLLQSANLLGSTANSMAFIAIPWLILELTGSATSTGLIVGISYVPVIVMAPLAGVLIDRWGRREVSILSDILSALSVAMIPLFAWTLGLGPGLILFAALLGAVFDPAGYTARKTLIQPVSTMTGIRLERTNALHEALFAFGFSIGPAVAAVSIGLIGTINTFLVIAVLSLLAAGFIAVLGSIKDGMSSGGETEPGRWWVEALRGFRELATDRALLVLTLFFVVVDLVYMPSEVVILPAYFQGVDNPIGLGLVISAMATGGIVGSYLFDPLSTRLSNRAIVTGAMILSSSGLFGLAFFPPVWAMVLAGVLVGLCWGPMGPLINTLVQTRVPEAVQGRVFGAQMALFSAGPPLGMMVVGALVDQWGVVIIYPALVLVVWVLALTIAALPVLRGLNTPPSSASGGL